MKIIRIGFILFLAVFLMKCRNNGSPKTNLSSLEDDKLLLEYKTRPSLQLWKQQVYNGFEMNDSQKVKVGLDSLFVILGESEYVSEKSEVAYFLAILIGEELNTKPMNRTLLTITESLRDSNSRCLRLKNLNKALDIRLLNLPGSEIATTAKSTYNNCLSIGKVIISDDNENYQSLGKIFDKKTSNEVQRIFKYYTEFCNDTILKM